MVKANNNLDAGFGFANRGMHRHVDISIPLPPISWIERSENAFQESGVYQSAAPHGGVSRKAC
jgi:hypothetical protein